MNVTRGDLRLFGLAGAATVLAAVTRYADLGDVTAFVVSGICIALLAALVGRSVDNLGDRFGAGATGVLQSALGNLPELFVCIFALRAGLIEVVQAAVIGSILGNVLLVLGLAFLVGGLRHGVQRFDGERARVISALMLLAVVGMVVPSLAHYVHSPADSHERALSVIASCVLLAVFICSVPASLRRTEGETDGRRANPSRDGRCGCRSEHLRSPVFSRPWCPTGSCMRWSRRSKHCTSARPSQVWSSSLSRATRSRTSSASSSLRATRPTTRCRSSSTARCRSRSCSRPVLVLLSFVIGGAAFTLVFPPLLVTTLVASVLVVAFIIIDAESVWLEGAALLGLYVVIAASFWWG